MEVLITGVGIWSMCSIGKEYPYQLVVKNYCNILYVNKTLFMRRTELNLCYFLLNLNRKPKKLTYRPFCNNFQNYTNTKFKVICNTQLKKAQAPTTMLPTILGPLALAND